MITKQRLSQSWLFLRTQLRGGLLGLALAIGLGVLLLLGLAPNASILLGAVSYGFETFVIISLGLIQGMFTSAEWYSVLLLVTVSALIGLNLALVIARSRRLRAAGATGVGSLLGLTLTGCPSCATGLLPLFGVSLGATSPALGFGFSIVGVVVLIVALYWNTTAEECVL